MTNALPPPNILLEQGAVILVNKPGGLLTQGPPGIDSLELRVKSFLKVRDEKPGKVYLGVPHRLDRPVSGVMVVVKNVRAANRISQQIRDRTVTKIYWTVVAGNVETDSGRWENWMRKIRAFRDRRPTDDFVGNPASYRTDPSNPFAGRIAKPPDHW